MKASGVRMIDIETPKGSFKVWKKRVGSDPDVKVLLTNGGPVPGTHCPKASSSNP